MAADRLCVPIDRLNADSTITVTVKVTGVFRFRIWLSKKCFEAGIWVLGARSAVTIESNKP